MNDYMRALHQRFYREPDFSKLEEDIESTRQEVRDCLDKMRRRSLTAQNQDLQPERDSTGAYPECSGALP